MAIWYMNTEENKMNNTDETIHTYERDERLAVVNHGAKGFYVELWESGKCIEIRECFDHSESWAESVAENYVDGLLNV
jgi:hypothetical protein|tara:strand:+ start:582 stop:815 length:234 start_codon:yes stop_codon:yes gene_type:complete